MSTIVVAGALANKPGNGGEAWVRLSWIRGLQQLGAEVFLLEELDPSVSLDRGDGDAAVSFFRDAVSEFGLEDHCALISEHEVAFGLDLAELRVLAADADLLVNISGHLRIADLFERFRRKAYVDLDPGFTQFWHERGLGDLGLDAHDLHFTVGADIGDPECLIPTCGFEWLPVRQPVVLDDWPVHPPAQADVLTTVGSWRGAYGPIERCGSKYGVKAHEFRKFFDLPRRVSQQLELALSIHDADDADRQQLLEHGWQLVDPHLMAGDPGRFRRYVQQSGGEFSVAQGIYVDTRSGWFSDRTTRYLASGKPALVQDTGYSRSLPVGEGLVPFSTIEEAAAGAQSIERRYREHCESARDIAERFFDARVVLTDFLDRTAVMA